MATGRRSMIVVLFPLAIAPAACRKTGPGKVELRVKETLLTICRYDRTPPLDPDLELVPLERQADARVVDVPLLIQTRRGVWATTLASVQADLQLPKARRRRPRHQRLKNRTDLRRLTIKLSSLRTAGDTLRQRHAPATRLHLAIAPAVSAAEVLRALEAAHGAGYREASFLFRPTRFGKVTPPDRRVYQEILGFKKQQQDWQKRASKILAERHAKRCPPAADVLRRMLYQARRERCAYLLRDLPGALKRCGYKDHEALLSGVAALFSRPKGGLVATRVVTLKPEQQFFQVKRNARWQDVAPQAARHHGRSFWFSIREY